MSGQAKSGKGKLRGQPLAALLAVLAGWIGGRAASWEAPLLPVSQDKSATAASIATGAGTIGTAGMVPGPLSLPGAGYAPMQGAEVLSADDMPLGRMPAAVFLQYPGIMGRWGAMAPAPAIWQQQGGSLPPPRLAGLPDRAFLPPGQADYYRIDPMPPGFAPGVAAPQAAVLAPQGAAPPRPRRWTADAWVLWRRGSEGGVLAGGQSPATYGASQAGAVMRYRLAQASRYQPMVYLRSTSTIGAVQETSAAFGFSGRPFPEVPVVAALEGRLTDAGGMQRFQPTAMAYTQLAPVRLPASLRAQAYAQAGYVGGKFATPFADGQVRVDREVIAVGKFSSRLGGGVWGGGQKGAARLDAGPSISAEMPIGPSIYGSLAVDWRFRVAGDAEPGSGPAVTLSAGF